MGFDYAAMGQAFSYPGIDPRQWCSVGVVDPETPEAPSVRFKDDAGAPLPTGPLVTVTLQPCGITVVCRVASFLAGNGEGTWFPIQQGDEVLVALPSGSERLSPTIIGRMNQEIDVWPQIVAGQDASANNFGFWRLRTPFIIESAEAFLIRSAKTGSQVGIDGTGQVILNDGDRNHLFIGADAINLGDGDQVFFLQIDFNKQRIILSADSTRMELASSGRSILQCAGELNIGVNGASGRGHAVTIEQVVALLINWTIMLAGPSGSSTLMSELTAAGKLLSSLPSPFPAQFQTPLVALLNSQVTPTTPAPSVTGGNFAMWPLVYGLTGAITTSLLVPLPTSDPTGFIPGTGRGGLVV